MTFMKSIGAVAAVAVFAATSASAETRVTYKSAKAG